MDEYIQSQSKCLDSLEASLEKSEELLEAMKTREKPVEVKPLATATIQKLKVEFPQQIESIVDCPPSSSSISVTTTEDKHNRVEANNNYSKSQLSQLLSPQPKEEKTSVKSGSPQSAATPSALCSKSQLSQLLSSQPEEEKTTGKSGSPKAATPSAPKFTKISLTDDGVLLNWEPETNGSQCEYIVLMAVQFEETKPIPSKGRDHTYAAAAESPSKIDYVFVYKGSQTQCLVSHSKLAFAHRSSNKPVFIFRISAKNEIGQSQTTQVKWIKTSLVGVKRAADTDLSVPVSKVPK